MSVAIQKISHESDCEEKKVGHSVLCWGRSFAGGWKEGREREGGKQVARTGFETW